LLFFYIIVGNSYVFTDQWGSQFSAINVVWWLSNSWSFGSVWKGLMGKLCCNTPQFVILCYS